jgi:formamidopyrimidine-DNA glycosylase
MPELPEVQTTASILNLKLKDLTITDVWTDYDSTFHAGKDNIKNKKYFPHFKKGVLNKKVLSVSRRAKNVLINVSGNKTILVHMKMTGHLLYGKFTFDGKKWVPPQDGKLDDPFNRFIHLALSLSNKYTLVLSDARKFAKVTVFDTDTFGKKEGLHILGPEPLERGFTYKIFKEQIYKKPNGKIKTVLMNPEIIAGIGNIYSDEILWLTGIHPLERVYKIGEKKLKDMYTNILKILKQSIAVGGDSLSDYRNPFGEKGGYQNIHKAYRQTGRKCQRKGCNGTIQRIVVGGRSAHYCNVHQKLTK